LLDFVPLVKRLRERLRDLGEERVRLDLVHRVQDGVPGERVVEDVALDSMVSDGHRLRAIEILAPVTAEAPVAHERPPTRPAGEHAREKGAIPPDYLRGPLALPRALHPREQ